MESIKAHFDGTAVILDEPASLAVGQPVQVIVEAVANGVFGAEFNPHPDQTITLMTGVALDERDEVQVNSLERVPSDFVRKPGSGKGQIQIAPDFDATPDDFKDVV